MADMVLGAVGQQITQKLDRAFQPAELVVRDDSARHHGHAGARPQGETHFHVRIVARAFVGQSRVAAHRMVNAVLADELKGPVHALSLEIVAG